jgi:predicted dehydrogenase
VETLRLGYIGCGFMAQYVHLPNFSTLPNVDLLALAELRPELGQKVQQRFGIPRLYRDHQELLADPDIEAVALSAAFHVQGQLALDALRAGKDVFMEKPMAISLAMADAILDAEQHSGKRLMIGYMKRYDAGNELVKSLIDESRHTGEFGDLTYLRNHSFGGNWLVGLEGHMDTTDEPMPTSPVTGPDWLPPDWLDPYVGYLQQFTHNVNLLRYFANAGDNVTVRTVDLDDDGYGGVVVLDLNGIRGTLESGRMSHHRWDEHTQVYFRDGWIHTWAPPLMQRQASAELEIYRAGKTQTVTRPILAPGWAYRREADFFVNAVQTGTPFHSTATDTRTDVRLFEDIYRHFLTQKGVL